MTRLRVLLLCMLVALGLIAGSAAWAEALGRTTVPLSSEGARASECTLGDLVADAVRAQFGADIGLVPSSMLIEGTIPAGDIAADQLRARLFSPEEPVVLVQMPGSTVLAALERSLSFLPRSAPAFLQVSGLSVTFRQLPAPAKRIESVQVGAAPLAPDKVYRVAMPSSLAKGSLGYFRIFDGLQPRQTGPGLGEVVSRYVQTSGTITIKPGARLRDVTPPKA